MKKLKKVARKASLFIALLMVNASYAFADQGDVSNDVANKISKFGELFGAIVSAVGAVVLIWSAVNLGLAIKRRDPAATTEALLGFAAGLIIALAPQVVSYVMS